MAIVTDYTGILNYSSSYGYYRWNKLLVTGSPAVVTYSFAETLPTANTGATGTFAPLTDDLRSQTRAALNSYAAVSGLSFVEVPAATGGSMEIFAMSSAVAGTAYWPVVNADIGGNLELNQDYLLTDMTPGGAGYQSMLGLIGYANGLNGPSEGENTLETSLAVNTNTVMVPTVSGAASYAAAPQSLDIAALSFLYGDANSDTGISATWNARINKVLITASGDGVVVAATENDDYVIGTAGDDTIQNIEGSDVIAAGGGTDIVAYNGSASQYTASVDGGLLTITPDGTDLDQGTDILLGVELLAFVTATGEVEWVDTTALSDGGAADSVYRFFNYDTGAHFFAGSRGERDAVIEALPNMRYESAAFRSAADGDLVAYRFYNTDTGAHFYTTTVAERDQVIDTLPSYTYEGEGFRLYGSQRDGTNALHRFYNTDTGAHFYTASEAEKAAVEVQAGFNYEGVAGWVLV